HDYVFFSADVNEVEIALGALVMCRISHELAVNATNAHSADGTREWNIRNAQCSGRAIDRENVGIVLAIGTEQNRDDLSVVKISLRKKRPQWPIDHSRSKRLLFCRTTFAFEIAAGKFSYGSRFLAVINC